MTPDLRHRHLRIEGLDIRLNGVEPGVARAVAADLPAAVAAQMGAAPGVVAGDLRLASGSAADVTQALAREIAARLQAGLARAGKDQG